MTAKAAQGKKSLDDFRKAHDKRFIIPQRIKEALAKIGDGWEYEMDFIRIAGINTADLGRYRDQFVGHYIETRGKNPKRVWTGSTKVAAEMQKMVDES